MVFMPLIYDKYTEDKEIVSENEKLEIIGIPVKLDADFIIVKEEENQLLFKLDDCENCIFTVNKKDIPNNMENVNLVVIINDDRYVSKLSGKEKITLDTPAIIPVLEIMILE
jgi:hypothetical protein